jgi:hypothetical protein
VVYADSKKRESFYSLPCRHTRGFLFLGFRGIILIPHLSFLLIYTKGNSHNIHFTINMASFKQMLLLALSLATPGSTHFLVNTPAPLGSNINNEDTAPCGGFTPTSSDTVTDFHVEGDAIGVSTLHAQAFFAYRAMLGTSLSSPNWTVLLPTVEEFGLNSFCEPSIPVPASWSGSSGLLQIIQDAEDGVHYQVCNLIIILSIYYSSTLLSAPYFLSLMRKSF